MVANFTYLLFVSDVIAAYTRIDILAILRHYFKLDSKATEATLKKWKKRKQYLTTLSKTCLSIVNRVISL